MFQKNEPELSNSDNILKDLADKASQLVQDIYRLEKKLSPNEISLETVISADDIGIELVSLSENDNTQEIEYMNKYIKFLEKRKEDLIDKQKKIEGWLNNPEVRKIFKSSTKLKEIIENQKSLESLDTEALYLFLENISKLCIPTDPTDNAFFSYYPDLTNNLIIEQMAFWLGLIEIEPLIPKEIKTPGHRWKFMNKIVELIPFLGEAFCTTVVNKKIDSSLFTNHEKASYFFKNAAFFLNKGVFKQILEGSENYLNNPKEVSKFLTYMVKEILVRELDELRRWESSTADRIDEINALEVLKNNPIKKNQENLGFFYAFAERRKESAEKRLNTQLKKVETLIDNLNVILETKEFILDNKLIEAIGPLLEKDLDSVDIETKVRSLILDICKKASKRLPKTYDFSIQATKSLRLIVQNLAWDNKPWDEDSESLLSYIEQVSKLINAPDNLQNVFSHNIPCHRLNINNQESRSIIREQLQKEPHDTQRVLRVLLSSYSQTDSFDAKQLVDSYRAFKKETSADKLDEITLLFLRTVSQCYLKRLDAQDFIRELSTLDACEREQLIPLLLDQTTINNFDDFYHVFSSLSPGEYEQYCSEPKNSQYEYLEKFITSKGEPLSKSQKDFKSFQASNINITDREVLHPWLHLSHIDPLSPYSLTEAATILEKTEVNFRQKSFFQKYFFVHLISNIKLSLTPDALDNNTEEPFLSLLQLINTDEVGKINQAIAIINNEIDSYGSQENLENLNNFLNYFENKLQLLSLHQKLYPILSLSNPDITASEIKETERTLIASISSQDITILAKYINNLINVGKKPSATVFFKSFLDLMQDSSFTFDKIAVDNLCKTFELLKESAPEKQQELTAEVLEKIYNISLQKPDSIQLFDSFVKSIFTLPKKGFFSFFDKDVDFLKNIKPIFDKIQNNDAKKFAQRACIALMISPDQNNDRKSIINLIKKVYGDGYDDGEQLEAYWKIVAQTMPDTPVKKIKHVNSFIFDQEIKQKLNDLFAAKNQDLLENIFDIMVMDKHSELDKIIELYRIIKIIKSGSMSGSIDIGITEQILQNKIEKFVQKNINNMSVYKILEGIGTNNELLLQFIAQFPNFDYIQTTTPTPKINLSRKKSENINSLIPPDLIKQKIIDMLGDPNKQGHAIRELDLLLKERRLKLNDIIDIFAYSEACFEKLKESFSAVYSQENYNNKKVLKNLPDEVEKIKQLVDTHYLSSFYSALFITRLKVLFEKKYITSTDAIKFLDDIPLSYDNIQAHIDLRNMLLLQSNDNSIELKKKFELYSSLENFIQGASKLELVALCSKLNISSHITDESINVENIRAIIKTTLNIEEHKEEIETFFNTSLDSFCQHALDFLKENNSPIIDQFLLFKDISNIPDSLRFDIEYILSSNYNTQKKIQKTQETIEQIMEYTGPVELKILWLDLLADTLEKRRQDTKFTHSDYDQLKIVKRLAEHELSEIKAIVDPEIEFLSCHGTAEMISRLEKIQITINNALLQAARDLFLETGNADFIHAASSIFDTQYGASEEMSLSSYFMSVDKSDVTNPLIALDSFIQKQFKRNTTEVSETEIYALLSNFSENNSESNFEKLNNLEKHIDIIKRIYEFDRSITEKDRQTLKDLFENMHFQINELEKNYTNTATPPQHSPKTNTIYPSIFRNNTKLEPKFDNILNAENAIDVISDILSFIQKAAESIKPPSGIYPSAMFKASLAIEFIGKFYNTKGSEDQICEILFSNKELGQLSIEQKKILTARLKKHIKPHDAADKETEANNFYIEIISRLNAVNMIDQMQRGTYQIGAPESQSQFNQICRFFNFKNFNPVLLWRQKNNPDFFKMQRKHSLTDREVDFSQTLQTYSQIISSPDSEDFYKNAMHFRELFYLESTPILETLDVCLLDFFKPVNFENYLSIIKGEFSYIKENDGKIDFSESQIDFFTEADNQIPYLALMQYQENLQRKKFYDAITNSQEGDDIAVLKPVIMIYDLHNKIASELPEESVIKFIINFVGQDNSERDEKLKSKNFVDQDNSGRDEKLKTKILEIFRQYDMPISKQNAEKIAAQLNITDGLETFTTTLCLFSQTEYLNKLKDIANQDPGNTLLSNIVSQIDQNDYIKKNITLAALAGRYANQNPDDSFSHIWQNEFKSYYMSHFSKTHNIAASAVTNTIGSIDCSAIKPNHPFVQIISSWLPKGLKNGLSLQWARDIARFISRSYSRLFEYIKETSNDIKNAAKKQNLRAIRDIYERMENISQCCDKPGINNLLDFYQKQSPAEILNYVENIWHNRENNDRLDELASLYPILKDIVHTNSPDYPEIAEHPMTALLNDQEIIQEIISRHDNLLNIKKEFMSLNYDICHLFNTLNKKNTEKLNKKEITYASEAIKQIIKQLLKDNYLDNFFKYAEHKGHSINNDTLQGVILSITQLAARNDTLLEQTNQDISQLIQETIKKTASYAEHYSMQYDLTVLLDAYMKISVDNRTGFNFPRTDIISELYDLNKLNNKIVAPSIYQELTSQINHELLKLMNSENLGKLKINNINKELTSLLKKMVLLKNSIPEIDLYTINLMGSDSNILNNEVKMVLSLHNIKKGDLESVETFIESFDGMDSQRKSLLELNQLYILAKILKDLDNSYKDIDNHENAAGLNRLKSAIDKLSYIIRSELSIHEQSPGNNEDANKLSNNEDANKLISDIKEVLPPSPTGVVELFDSLPTPLSFRK